MIGDRHVNSEETQKILFINAINLYARAMSRSLPYDEIEFDKKVKLEVILNAADDSDNDFSFICD